MSADMQLNGMDEIIKWAEETGEKVSAIVVPALQAAAEPMLEEIIHTSAFIDRSGDLRKSFKISKVKKKKDKASIWIGDVDAKVSYAWPLERGTSHFKAHPFMRPAFERQKETAFQIMREKIGEAIK